MDSLPCKGRRRSYTVDTPSSPAASSNDRCNETPSNPPGQEEGKRIDVEDEGIDTSSTRVGEWVGDRCRDAGKGSTPTTAAAEEQIPGFPVPSSLLLPFEKRNKKGLENDFLGIYVDVLLVLRIRSRNARREGATFRRTSAPCFGSKDGLGNGRKVLHVFTKRAGRKASGRGAQEDEPGRQEAELGLDGHGRRCRRAFARLGHLL